MAVLEQDREVREGLEEFEVEPPMDVGDGEGDDGGDDGGGGDGPWVTVGTYWHSIGAHMAQLRLESEEIESILLDENVAMALTANAVGGIKLQVRASDAQRARELLKAAVVLTKAQESQGAVALVCPACGSTQVEPVRRPSWVMLLAATVATLGLILVALPWLLKAPARWRRCLRCGHGWMVHEEKAGGFPVEGNAER